MKEQIITTILIILLVLSAIVIIWQVTINKTVYLNNFKIYKCYNGTITKEVCELKSDICKWNYNPKDEECIYYKKVKTQKEFCEEIKPGIYLEFCREGEISNGRCLVSFEKDDKNCKENCIGIGKYIEITKIKLKDLNYEYLDEKCQLLEESFNNKKYKCGNYLVKGGD